MTINTQNYQDAHGRKPKGHGAWTFLIGRRPGEYTEVNFAGIYSEACRKAKVKAKMIGGASSIAVLS